METGAFAQLTRKYMAESFNPRTPDKEGVRYFSYGASLEPRFWSVFWLSHRIIKQLEGAENDGLVRYGVSRLFQYLLTSHSVPSSQWGDYRGTLVGVSHLDLINWTNRLKWWIWELSGRPHNFNGVALYLHIADMLAAEGL
jgi:triacylglycerol lipase